MYTLAYFTCGRMSCTLCSYSALLRLKLPNGQFVDYLLGWLSKMAGN